MPHVPVKIQVIMEYAVPKAFSTKPTGTITILMGYYAFLFENSQKPEHLFVDIVNAEPAKVGMEGK